MEYLLHQGQGFHHCCYQHLSIKANYIANFDVSLTKRETVLKPFDRIRKIYKDREYLEKFAELRISLVRNYIGLL